MSDGSSNDAVGVKQAPRPDPREAEREAQRELRHGNLRGALALFKELAQNDPENLQLRARIATLEEGLQPMELLHPKAAAGAAARPMESDLQRGEAAANSGDLATAIACYQRVVASAPDNELAQDRLDELRAELGAAPVDPRPAFDPVAVLEEVLRRVQARRRQP